MDNLKVVVDGLIVPEGHRIYKIIVNQTENSDIMVVKLSLTTHTTL
ncbi:MAG: hypothetical protein IJJ47_13880 [Methanosphaera sp.]|nr:hypothetical protein [Methanosphaera sp.]